VINERGLIHEKNLTLRPILSFPFPTAPNHGRDDDFWTINRWTLAERLDDPHRFSDPSPSCPYQWRRIRRIQCTLRPLSNTLVWQHPSRVFPPFWKNPYARVPLWLTRCPSYCSEIQHGISSLLIKKTIHHKSFFFKENILLDGKTTQKANRPTASTIKTVPQAPNRSTRHITGE